MDGESVYKAGKEIAIKHALDALIKQVPVLGVMFESYEAYKKGTEEKLFKDFVYALNAKVERLKPQFDEEWLKSEDGQNFCSKVMASAMNAEYKDKQELFVNALINGTANSALETAEKFKFIDILRQLSRPALDVLAFMYGIREEIRGQNSERMAEIIVNANGSEGQLGGMDFYLVYACIVEIKNTGLLSTATEVKKNVADLRYRVTGSYSDGTESCTPFTQRFIEFVSEMH